jgi:hypothetical protein
VSECKEGKNGDKEKQSVPLCAMQKEVPTALSVLDSVIRCADVDSSALKAMDTVKTFVLKIHKNLLFDSIKTVYV